ncbi:winged helix DNA-binding domain-containing protein [Modestobacter sp. VKM Ac-2978]|uniref:winged helix DNA-binding domain-containing protein n=1 Tax=Modestobacter sp. VKM Ac-2978 TaxID=3004132 RepID=UPI0022AACD94|nr:winged helix DNA-binding domain-containing protein [Modestobacter sp. VKM Ac-2978]MCZ2850255.1 winged helix DNA-binding domain-containing protein [Modestobacter sp. VKM Ac-2978]
MSTLLDARALNRATLARQFLLTRTDTPALEAVTHLCGLQAQEPQEPFVGLWSRLIDVDPADLTGGLEERRLVRLHLMRRTVHLVTADDAWNWRPRHQDLLRQRTVGTHTRELAGTDLDELTRAAHELLADGRSRSLGEVGRALAARWPEPGPRVLGEVAVAALLATVQLPPRGTWRSTAGARYQLLSTWLGPTHVPSEADTAGHADQDLVRRYLTAFGPAASADLRAWCGLTGLPAAVTAIRDELVSFRDARGRELLDLPDAPRPDPDTPAPVRFLPAFDNVVLGFHDRSRIVDDEHRRLSVTGARMVLVDGRVAATWTHAPDSTEAGGTVTVTPLHGLTRAQRTEVTQEAHRLAAFLYDGRGRARIAART